MIEIQKEGRGFGIGPETILFTQAQAGCTESLNKIMERHEGFVHFVIQRQWLFTRSTKKRSRPDAGGCGEQFWGTNQERGSGFRPTLTRQLCDMSGGM